MASVSAVATRDGPATPAPTDGPPGRGRAQWPLAAVGVAAVLPFAATTTMGSSSWALRWALLPAIAGLGLPCLVAAALGRQGPAARRTARWALAWLGWAAVATVAAPDRTLALWGEYSVGTGLIFLAAVAGAWALGLRAGERAGRRIATVLLVGCAANAALAVAEQLVDLSALGVAPYQGRSAALFGNPVYLAELLTGGLWLGLSALAARAGPSPEGRPVVGRPVTAAAAVVLLAAGVELSGSRAALVLAVGATLVAAGRVGSGRTARAARPAALTVAASMVVAVALGIGLGAVLAGHRSAMASGTDRLAAGSTGLRPRADTWRGGLDALAARPVWGYGPGSFLVAASPHRTAAVARGDGPDTLYADAHNLVVESAVTTGVVGLVLLAAWLWTAARLIPGRGAGREGPQGQQRPHGPGDRAARWGLGGFAALVVLVTLAEPQFPGVTPLAALALGAAAAAVAAEQRPAARRPTRSAALAAAATTVTVAAGLALSVWFTDGLVALHRADLAGDPAAAARAARRLPPWGEPAAVVGRLAAFRGITGADPAGLDVALRWWSLAARRDAFDPSRWTDLGNVRARAGDDAAAAADYRRALIENPWSAASSAGLLHLGPSAGVTPAEAAAARARLHRLGLPTP